MDCADRIAVLATERTLEPVRALEGTDAPDAVTVRVLLARRRFDVTIRRARPRESEDPPTYAWEGCEVAENGAARPGGLELRAAGGVRDASTDAEDAYWTALEAIRATLDSARR